MLTRIEITTVTGLFVRTETAKRYILINIQFKKVSILNWKELRHFLQRIIDSIVMQSKGQRDRCSPRRIESLISFSGSSRVHPVEEFN